MPEEMDTKTEYQKMLAEHQDKIKPSAPGGVPEKRSHPRLKVTSRDLWINTVPEFSLVDMSASGLAVRSNSPLVEGELIQISLGSSFSVEAEVVSSRMLISPDAYTDGEFLIQCRFLEDLQGMKLLVKTVQYQS